MDFLSKIKSVSHVRKTAQFALMEYVLLVLTPFSLRVKTVKEKINALKIIVLYAH